MDRISLKPIGILHTPFQKREGIPRQAVGAREISATIEIFPEYAAGLADLDGFSHIVVLFFMHLIQTEDLIAHPPWDQKPHGIFSTCSPFRPNHLGVSVVELEKIEGNRLAILGVDMADGSPVLDIKPYVPDLHPKEKIRLGWMDSKIEGMTDSKTGDR